MPADEFEPIPFKEPSSTLFELLDWCEAAHADIMRVPKELLGDRFHEADEAGHLLEGTEWPYLSMSDGVALLSAAHPMGSGPIPPSRLSRDSLERIRIDIPLPAVLPEVEFVYSGAEFNEEFGPTQLARIARARAETRFQRTLDNRARYRRMCRRT